MTTFLNSVVCVNNGEGMKALLYSHLDTLITVSVTVLGFLISSVMMHRSFQNEIRRDKISKTTDCIQTLPYEICQLMDIAKSGGVGVEDYKKLMTKVLSYGSNNAVKIAIKMQEIVYMDAELKNDNNRYTMLTAYALLISQVKYDLTDEIISPESWFRLKITDYQMIRDRIKTCINSIIKELQLNKDFRV